MATRGSEAPRADSRRSTETKRQEVLVLDSSTFIEEAGLTSRDASALKHYLYLRGMRLVVPEVVAEQCERNLATIAKGKKDKIEDHLRWLGRFSGGVNGWEPPSDGAIKGRAKQLANANHLGATVLPETDTIRERAEARSRAERPPSHRRPGLDDCRIWEQCLDLLVDHDVVLVSGDSDFCGHQRSDELHPQLRAEAREVASGQSLTFYPNMESLLSELRTERPSIPKEVAFAFVYDEIAADMRDLESDSGCRPKATGDVKQTLLTTDQADVIEVRLEVEDQWESPDGADSCEFRLRGWCRYHLADRRPCDLTVSSMELLITKPDGSVRAAKGSFTRIQALVRTGPQPIEPEPEVLG